MWRCLFRLGYWCLFLWKEFRQLWKTAAFGLGCSLGIELLQIFTYRLTDIDDLIMNTLGCVLGFLAVRRISGNFDNRMQTGEGNFRQELIALIAAVFLVWAVVQPHLLLPFI